MKTIDGAPQFDNQYYAHAESINIRLRVWADGRRCWQCQHCVVNVVPVGNKALNDGWKCNVLGFKFGNIEPSVFSCAAFESAIKGE